MSRSLLVLLSLAAASALPAATHRLGSEVEQFDGRGVAPGDTIVLAAGRRGALRLQNIHGAERQPVTVRPEGALVIAGNKDYAVKISDSTQFVFTGVPNGGTEGVLQIEGGQNSVVVTGFSSDFTVERLEIEHSGFAGMMIKLDPTDDPRTWRDAFTMRNIVVRDNIVRHTGGEGFYIGNSFYATGHLTASKVRRPPHAIIGLKVLRNRTSDTGCEGIQVGCATADCEVAENVIEKFGQRPFGPYQDNGLQIGEGTGGVVRDNVIRDGPGNGLIVLGLGDNIITGNQIEHAGGNGIYAQTTPPEIHGEGYRITGNTIIASGREPIAIRAPQLGAISVSGNHFVSLSREQPVLLLAGTHADVRDNEILSAER